MDMNFSFLPYVFSKAHVSTKAMGLFSRLSKEPVIIRYMAGVKVEEKIYFLLKNL